MSRLLQTVFFLAAITLGWIWFDVPGYLLIACFLFAAGALGTSYLLAPDRGAPFRSGPETGGSTLNKAVRRLNRSLTNGRVTGASSAVFALEINGLHHVVADQGVAAGPCIRKEVMRRLQEVVRGSDMLVELDPSRILVVMTPPSRFHPASLLQTGMRLQSVVNKAVFIGQTQIFLSISVGVCSADKVTPRSGVAMVEAALSALKSAKLDCGGEICIFSGDPWPLTDAQQAASDDVVRALNTGQITAWFQPQVDVRTGTLVGMEAVARWQHPSMGTILPRFFLPSLEATGHATALNERMLVAAFSAMKLWQDIGFDVPATAVNFGPAELSDPTLPERVKCQLKRFGLAPENLIVEILETVIATPSDTAVPANLEALSQAGYRIDLDDFRGSNACIASLRRFPVDRVKIDRSLVQRVDQNAGEETLVTGVLAMAKGLGLKVLAEGAETSGELAKIAEMGFDHVQGFSVAAPMPLDVATNWIRENSENWMPYPQIHLDKPVSRRVSPESTGKTA